MEQALEGVYNEGKSAFHTKVKNPYTIEDQYYGEWLAGWKYAKATAQNKANREVIEDVVLSENKEKAIKEFSKMIAKDCAKLIETVIEKRVRIYATHLAEIMQQDNPQK
jgi:hypothetical protein